MAIDPKEVDSIEQSMVHDVDEEPKPEGWGIYLTLRYLSKVALAVYGAMLFGMVVVQALWPTGEAVPVILMPQSVLIMLPVACVAIYFYLISEPEPEVEKQRTTKGRAISFVAVFIAMQALAILLWVGLAKAFRLH